MRLALIGFGQAGGKIVDRLVEYDHTHNTGIVVSSHAVNTAETDLYGLETIPEENRVLIGEERVKGHGVGADNELGAEIAETDSDQILAALDSIPVHEVDAFLIVAGLGGGTGSGGAPVLASELADVYTEPVYGLGVLPAEDEGGIYTLNAARSFQTFVRETDSLLVFDNDAWRESGESVKEGYGELNQKIVERFGTLFSAGEIDPSDNDVGESVVDSSEIINTFGNGVTTIGHATDTVETASGLLGRLRGKTASVDEADAVNRITSLTRQAALGKLTLPCELDSVERALVLVSGEPEYLNRKGIERARQWLEDELGTMEVRGGDDPIPGSGQVSVTIVLSGASNIPRVKELQAVAIEAQENIEELRKQSDEQLAALVQDEDDELEPLF